MTLIDDIMPLVQDVQVATHGGMVRIERGNQSRANVPATFGQSTRKQTDAEGVTTNVIAKDFLIAPYDYVLADQPVAPERGDAIVVVTPASESATGEAVTRRFTVFDLSGEPAVRQSGPGRRRWRIHTKQTGGPP